MQTVLDVLHVLTAVFIVGPMAILPMTAMRAMRAGHTDAVRSLATSTYVFSLASLIVVILGFGVLGMSEEKYELSVTTPWILASIICYVVALALNLAVVVPALRMAADHAPDDTPDATTHPDSSAYQKVAMSSGIATLLLVAVVVLMVWKP